MATALTLICIRVSTSHLVHAFVLICCNLHLLQIEYLVYWPHSMLCCLVQVQHDIMTNYIHYVYLLCIHQQNNQSAVGRCGCCGCCGDPQCISPTDIPPSPTAHSQQPSTHSQHHRTSVKYCHRYDFLVRLTEWT